MSISSQRERPSEGKIGLDSRAQVRHMLMDEIVEWANNYEIDLTLKEIEDLLETIDEGYEDGCVYPLDFPETVDTDEEHYNRHVTVFG